MPTLLVRVPQRAELIEFYTHTHTNIYTVLSIYRESEKAGLKLNIQKLRSWHLSPSLHGKYMAKKWKLTDFIFLGSKITADSDCSHKIKDTCPLKKSYDKSRQHIKKQRYHFAEKAPYSQIFAFSR